MINLLVLITDEKNVVLVKSILKEYNLIFSLLARGRGTASESVLSYFGLDETKKDIYATLITKSSENKILQEITRTLEVDKHGNGICFTIPLSGSNKYVNDLLIDYKEVVDMEVKDRYHLIVTSVLEGYSEQVISAAKKAGAVGGTIFSGRSLGTENANFLKMKVEAEKDIVLIVVPEYKKNEVMHFITIKAGIKTEAKGVCFSLPIDSIIGINN